MATYQDEIYKSIGAIIKIVQYIECNLLNKLNAKTFADMTLGQIIGLVKKQKYNTRRKSD
jgi:hypothetical protein